MKRFSLKLGVVSLVVLVATTLTSARTPTGYSAIKGTWLNASSGALVKIVVGTDSTGRLFVHPYGACSRRRAIGASPIQSYGAVQWVRQL